MRKPAPPTPSPGGGKSTGDLVRQSNRWRDNYNPLRSLVISRVVAMIEAAERGDFAELQLTLRKVEKRYPVLKALRSRRLAAMEELDWDIKLMDPLPAGVSEAEAGAQRAFLRSRYDLVTNLPEAFGFLALAEIRGFSILQRHDLDDGSMEFHWLPQWCFSRDGEFGDWFWNPDSKFGVGSGGCVASLGEQNRISSSPRPSEGRGQGEGFQRELFIIREVDVPLYEIALIGFVQWSMGRKDWAAFTEIFGLPNAIVILPANIPPGQETTYRDAAEKVADGISGALPSGSDAKFPTAGVRNNGPFAEFCEAQDRDLVLAGTGGLLTMLSQPTGIGQGASGEHGDAFRQIARAEARKISAALQSDFDKVELGQQFPGQPVAAYFELAAEDEEDVTALVAQIAQLKGAGYAVAQEEVGERTGFELEESDEFPAPPDAAARGQAAPGGAGLPSSGASPEDDTGEGNVKNRSAIRAPDLAAALAADLAPVRERLQRILTIETPDVLKTKLQAFLAELPQLLRDLQADPEAARVIEALAAPALAAGLAGKSAIRNPQSAIA